MHLVGNYVIYQQEPLPFSNQLDPAILSFELELRNLGIILYDVVILYKIQSNGTASLFTKAFRDPLSPTSYAVVE